MFHTVTFERTCKEGEELKSTQSFGIDSDLDALDRCLFGVKVWRATQVQKQDRRMPWFAGALPMTTDEEDGPDPRPPQHERYCRTPPDGV